MQSFQLSSHIDPQGVLKLQLPKNFASQDVDVILVVESKNTPSLLIKKENFKKRTIPFGERLKEFLKEVDADPFDIDTSIFDNDRKSVATREFKWED